METTEFDLTRAAQAIRSRELSSTELIEQTIAMADQYDEALGVFLSRFNAEARTAASVADTAVAKGEALGPLHGIPIGVKDILTTIEGPTTAQSPALPPEWGAGDAEVVSRLRRAGAIVVGKTSTLEFAYGLPDPSHPFTTPANPWDVSTWAGGSSSGSGSGVAAGMMLGALGTDTGGSVRVPASMCGISAIKPTTGLVASDGCVPLAYSVDTIGPMARSARDCALLLAVMTDTPVAPAREDLSGLRIGVATMSGVSGDLADPAVFGLFDSAVQRLTELGAECTIIELPLHQEMTDAAYITIAAERLTWHHPLLADRWEDYGASAREGMTRAAHYSAADYVQAQRVRRQGQMRIAELFRDIDIIVSPMCSRTAPALDQIADCMRTWKSLVHATYWNALGNPAASVPMGFGSNGLPIGLQIIGKPFDDALVLQVGQAYQEVTDWHRRTPPMTAIRPLEPVTAISAEEIRVHADEPSARALELGQELLERGGIPRTPAEVAAFARGIGPSRESLASLYAVDCGDHGSALQLDLSAGMPRHN